MKIQILILLIILTSVTGFCQDTSQQSLINETMIHPADAFTAYTLEKGEWIYNQPFALSPGWAWWAITDNITTELDLECWLGGVASFNFRIKLMEQNGVWPALAYETMYQYLPKEINQLADYDDMNAIRKGHSWFNRINASWKIGERFNLHLSGGATYSQHLELNNNDTINYTGKVHKNYFGPDISISTDWRMANWISFHCTNSYGVTFVYIDNIPLKYENNTGFRIAPFYKNRFGFLKSFRMEVINLTTYFSDSEHLISFPYGYLYWQWRF